MEIEKNIFSEYFRKSLVHLGKSKPTFFILSTIEFIELATNMVDHIFLLFHYGEKYEYRESKLSNLILKISPYQYYYNYLSENYKEGFNSNYIIIILFVIFYIWLVTFLLLKGKIILDEDSQNQTIKLYFQKLEINFFDYFIFRLLPFYSIDTICREIFSITSKTNCSTIDYIFLVLSCGFLLFITIFHCSYYSCMCIWSNFQVIDCYFRYYPYDQFFSSKYDILSYFLKLFIVINQNYLFFNNENIDFIVVFIVAITIGLFLAFFVFFFRKIFFTDEIMFIFLNYFNKCRIFYMLFIFEWIILRLLLHKQEDYVPFLIYTVIFLFLDIYIIIAHLKALFLARIANNQNFLGVCWFIQNNDIDKEQFITEWVANHKTQCNEECCLICFEIGGEEKKLFSEIYSDDEESGNGSNKNILVEGTSLLNKPKEKKRNILLNKNLINKIFPSYKFSYILLEMAAKSKKFMTVDDLIRFDFLRICILFLSDKSIEFHLFSELCLLIRKYVKNINVFVSLLLIFDIIKKTNLKIIKGYDLIKKNEDLRDSLSDYIQEYENFIHYGDKSPISYIHISKKFNIFKDLVRSIHVLFKKNIEGNYQLLLMRYCYETLLHLQFKNVQPFDLNYYNDFLDFHYNNDKLFLIKYTITNDTFRIIKGSKDILKYQGKYLQNIFPENFERIGINRYREHLLNKEQKDIKPLFEFFIKSLTNNEMIGFIESFKMKYFIYPTTNVNELLIQGNYISNYSYLMVFILTENEQILYLFSTYIYKFSGLTPNIIQLLRNSKINILFSDLFSNHSLSKADQTKNIYKFSYEKYFMFYSSILQSDVLKELNTFTQFKEKSKEIYNMANDKKEILFQINKKWEFNQMNSTYIIYTIKEQKRKKRPGEKSIARDAALKSLNSEGDSSREEDENRDEFDDVFEGKGITMATSTLSSASLSQGNQSNRSSFQRGKKSEKNDEKQKKSEELKRYTIFILLFSVVLVGITLFFLVIEIRQNENFKSLFNLFETFRIFKRGIESSPLSLLSNYKVYSEKNKNGTSIYKEYSIKVANESGIEIFKKLYIYQIIVMEISVKYNIILEEFDNYERTIFKLGSDVSSEISALSGFSYTLIREGGEFKLLKKRTNLIGLIREYNNIITTLIGDSAYIDEIFSLITFGRQENNIRDISLEMPLKSLNENTKNMLLLLLMYPFIHDGLTQSSTLMEKLFDSSLKNIERYLIVFYVVLLLLHFILIVICIIFLITYIKMMKINIFASNQLFADKKFLDMQNKRIEQLKIMNNLYSENPLKIVERIDYIDEMYRRLTKSENIKTNKTHVFFGSQESFPEDSSGSKNSKKKLKNSDNNETKTDSKNDYFKESQLKQMNSFEANSTSNTDNKKSTPDGTDKINDNNGYFDNIVSKNISINSSHFRKIINKESIILAISFSIYYIYNIIFFIFVINGKNRLNKLIQYTSVNNLIDGYIFDNINAMLYLYITNSTSEFYSSLIDAENAYDYVKIGIDTFYQEINKKETLEEENPNLFPRLSKSVNLNCSEYIITDQFFAPSFNKLEENYEEYISAICSLFPVARTGSDINMLYEICYNTELLYQTYLPNENFTVIFENYLCREKMYKLYTFVLTLNRIVRSYFNNNIFSHEVDNLIGYFSKLIITYLILSVVLELGLFFVLNFGIISDVRRVNKLLMDFICSLNF